MTREIEPTGLKTSIDDKEDLEYLITLLEHVVEEHPDIECDTDECRNKARQKAREKRGPSSTPQGSE